MHIEIIAVGQKMPDWVNRGYADYADRLTGDLTLGLTEIPLQKRGSASQLAAAQNKEAAQIRSALHACDHIVTLDIPGQCPGRADLWHRRADPQLDIDFWDTIDTLLTTTIDPHRNTQDIS